MKNKKVLRLLSLVTLIFILANTFAVVGFASGDNADVYVTIANNGAPVVYNAPVSVSDVDGDDAVTINDALIIAHAQYYSGGESGYETAVSQYGLGITKLWGNTNNGSFGYYVNDASAWSLTDLLNDGDNLYAFCYKDAEGYSDKYAYFNIKSLSDVVEGESFDVTLKMQGYDESWNPVEIPVANAIITIDGVDTDFVTDENGVASVTIEDSLKHIISARPSEDSMIITPAVIEVKGNETDLVCDFGGNTYYYCNNSAQSGWVVFDGINYCFGSDGALTKKTVDTFVTIANNGAPVVYNAPVSVTDVDNDGMFTINDALIVTHTLYYSDGASGYETATTQYGLGITKLWGNTNKGSFGYYVNNVSAWSLSDSLVNGDYLYAFCYKDAEGYSDKYSYFNVTELNEVNVGESFNVTLKMQGYDESWNPVELPVVNAIITIDGVDTDFATDENGVAAIRIDDYDKHIISARTTTEGLIITPAVIDVIGENREIVCDFGGNTYYYIDNAVQSGFAAVDGKTCYFGADGSMVKKQLVIIDGKKYYFGADGAMYTKRLISVSGKKYYMGADGAAYTKRLISVNGKKYYMGADGVAYTKRLISVNGKKYYMGKDGVAYTKKLISVDGKKYYMGSDGVAYTKRLISIDGKKYYMGSDGVAYKSRLISLSGKKYYLGKDCIAYKSKFASLDGKKYYFGSDCVMYKSKTFSVNGVKYIADSNGVCKKK
ncbi:MAG: hypothetical protein J5877_03820 [Clostridia bacterium]|nr:hypothetical protein [Clostridia bacterium]